MSNARIIFGIVMAIFFIVCLTFSVPAYLQSLEDVKIAEQEEKNAKAEYEQAQREVDAILTEVGQ